MVVFFITGTCMPLMDSIDLLGTDGRCRTPHTLPVVRVKLCAHLQRTGCSIISSDQFKDPGSNVSCAAQSKYRGCMCIASWLASDDDHIGHSCCTIASVLQPASRPKSCFSTDASLSIVFSFLNIQQRTSPTTTITTTMMNYNSNYDHHIPHAPSMLCNCACWPAADAQPPRTPVMTAYMLMTLCVCVAADVLPAHHI